jgi:hypothetical protein
VGDKDDKRRFLRQRVLREGRLVFNDGSSVINCIIRQLSPGGAKLRLPAPTYLPRSLALLCLTSEMLYSAEIAWRHGVDLGLVFTGEPRRLPAGKMARSPLDPNGVIRPAPVESPTAMRKH